MTEQEQQRAAEQMAAVGESIIDAVAPIMAKCPPEVFGAALAGAAAAIMTAQAPNNPGLAAANRAAFVAAFTSASSDIAGAES